MPQKKEPSSGLAALKKPARHEGEKSRQQQENDDEDIGDRRGKISASSRLVMVLMLAREFISFSPLFQCQAGDAAEDFVQAAFLGVQFLDLPGAGRRQDVAGQVAVALSSLWDKPAPRPGRFPP
jgi:hypothetical protein